jgi:hypothetical protein
MVGNWGWDVSGAGAESPRRILAALGSRSPRVAENLEDDEVIDEPVDWWQAAVGNGMHWELELEEETMRLLLTLSASS